MGKKVSINDLNIMQEFFRLVKSDRELASQIDQFAESRRLKVPTQDNNLLDYLILFDEITSTFEICKAVETFVVLHESIELYRKADEALKRNYNPYPKVFPIHFTME